MQKTQALRINVSPSEEMILLARWMMDAVRRLSEVKDTIQQLKTIKAAGNDGIAIELLKMRPDTLAILSAIGQASADCQGLGNRPNSTGDAEGSGNLFYLILPH